MIPAENPFVRYRHRLDSYRRWSDIGGTDEEFVAIVESLDAAVALVEAQSGRDARGFVVTPTLAKPDLAEAAGVGHATLWIKDETNNVSGSHKARHLFGLALHAAVDARTSRDRGEESASNELVISSCGNAALAAAVVAKAADRALRVFIPLWADEAVVAALVDLDATIERCERREGEIGDPCYLRFREAVASGSTAFSVQGSDVPKTLDGGRTIGWELAEQSALVAGGPGHLDRVFVQVGGGALGTCLAAGLSDGVDAGWIHAMPAVSTVQTEAAAPLARAWAKLSELTDPLAALDDDRHRAMMWPWEPVGQSAATGILDDVTYDWVPLTRAMIASGGAPLVVSEALIVGALELGRRTGIDVDATGTAGLAGVLSVADDIATGEQLAVLFTGHRR